MFPENCNISLGLRQYLNIKLQRERGGCSSSSVSQHRSEHCCVHVASYQAQWRDIKLVSDVYIQTVLLPIIICMQTYGQMGKIGSKGVKSTD